MIQIKILGLVMMVTKMIDNIINGLEASIEVCKFFNSPEEVLKSERKIKKTFTLKKNNRIDYTILLDMVQTKIQEGQCSVVLVKYTDKLYKRYSGFKIIAEILLNPKENIRKYKSSLWSKKRVVNDFRELLKDEGSINQFLAFARKDEEMQGAGFYSVIFSAKSEIELRNNPSEVLEDIIDECQFEVIGENE